MGWMGWDGMKTRYVHGCVLGRIFADGEIWRHRQTEHPNNTSFFLTPNFACSSREDTVESLSS